MASLTCSAAAASITTPSRVSSSQVPCPGEITNALPPSRAIPAWKEARVRSEGLKKRSARIFPFNASGSGWRSSRPARASSSATASGARSDR